MSLHCEALKGSIPKFALIAISDGLYWTWCCVKSQYRFNYYVVIKLQIITSFFHWKSLIQIVRGEITLKTTMVISLIEYRNAVDVIHLEVFDNVAHNMLMANCVKVELEDDNVKDIQLVLKFIPKDKAIYSMISPWFGEKYWLVYPKIQFWVFYSSRFR